ncbi:hypothetical protein [Chryseobacterium sp.]|uniref:hypothetical protein n=1 Tax=Chryseobacterium sp. TaxID=1871047 RepID=UPI0025C3BB60|nr:hypothetical protein [Chryseobacterium sp.]MBV8325716.1 hypothetical protein [Chryseobacterium sp.]
MKNFLFPGAMSLALFFNSCSSNDESPEKKIMVSTITTIYYDNPSKPQTSISSFEYNSQGEVIKMNTDGRTATYEYNNGKPVKANYYTSNQALEYSSVFNYSGDRLISSKTTYTNPDYNRNYSYTYDTNGKVVSSSLCQSENCSKPSSTAYTYNGDNVSSETSLMSGPVVNGIKREFSYDDKFTPLANTNKYLRIMTEGAMGLSKNNYTTEKISYKDNSGNWILSQNITYSILYNSTQLPVQVIGKEANGNNYVQYNYEYISQ